VGKHEVRYVYDGGRRWNGLGVQKAVGNIEKEIAPALRGLDAARQREVDETLIRLDGTPDKSRLGGNALAAVSAAVLKAGAASLGIPLYQHIGGVNACILPVPGVIAVYGSTRYGGGKRAGGKPSYAFLSHGFATFREASYACWEVREAFEALLREKYDLMTRVGFEPLPIPPGVVSHDRELWELMAAAIDRAGHGGRIGLHVDIAACCFYDASTDRFCGLFSAEDKSREELMDLYRTMVSGYPFLILEDPLDEDDYEGHAALTRELGVEIVGDDLFTTNVERLRKGVETGACNAVLLKVNQIGTISEAFDFVEVARRNGYGVMPCSSRGEGPDIGDYAVGLGTGHVRECGLDHNTNRLLQIEAELGSRARFLGRGGLKP
jgi:enolase